MAVWDRLHELVPREDEVGENEEDGSECIEAAALEQGSDEHCADDAGVDADTGADDAGFSQRRDAREYDQKQGDDAECHHRKVSLRLEAELPVTLDFLQVALSEKPDVEYVADCEEPHLSQEVTARSHKVAHCREKERERDLPRAEPERCEGQKSHRNSHFVR